MNVIRHLALLALPMMVVACTTEPEAPATTETTPASTPADTSTSSQPRVFFVQPQDGATVKSPVALRFGLENYELAAVPPGEITTVRPGVGHHHVGVDKDCLPAGTNIVKGTPDWMHFGKAETEMSPGIQLTPGQHKLTLQLADDLHNAIPGMCQTITVTVE